MLVPTFTITIVAALLFTYMVAVRPWHLQWGASHLDRVARLPGDELSPRAPSAITRAISVSAPPEKVWPWAEKIAKLRAERDHLAIAIETAPEAIVIVAAADLARIKAGDDAMGETWAFFLKPMPGGQTRVIARLRAAAFPSLGVNAMNFFVREPAHFLAERKMLRAIKQGAEQQG
jgi:hypothetical protein